MTPLTDELAWISEDTNDIIKKLLGFLDSPEIAGSSESAPHVENDILDALKHLLKAQSFLVSSSVYARHCQPQPVC